jgi:hypothetical protein
MMVSNLVDYLVEVEYLGLLDNAFVQELFQSPHGNWYHGTCRTIVMGLILLIVQLSAILITIISGAD